VNSRAFTDICYQDSFETCPPLDIVLIGAYFPGYNPTESELAFIRKAHDESVAFLNICSGFIPGHLAGVLVGKTATAPRFMVPELQKQDPRTNWVEKRYVRDGKIWTSGALLNGLDLMREFILEYWPDLARIVVSSSGIPIRDVHYQGADGLPVSF
jgi:transcriptional regulator GlxA family with amidase domain